MHLPLECVFYLHKPVVLIMRCAGAEGIWGCLRGEETETARDAKECERTDILASGHLPLHPTASDITRALVMSPGPLSLTPPTPPKGSHSDAGLMQGHVFLGSLMQACLNISGGSAWPSCLKEPPLSLFDVFLTFYTC